MGDNKLNKGKGIFLLECTFLLCNLPKSNLPQSLWQFIKLFSLLRWVQSLVSPMVLRRVSLLRCHWFESQRLILDGKICTSNAVKIVLFLRDVAWHMFINQIKFINRWRWGGFIISFTTQRSGVRIAQLPL